MDIKEFNSIWKYHKMILCVAWRETLRDLFGDIKNIVGDIVIAVMSGLLYAVWSYIKQDTMIDWLGVLISVIGGFVSWSIILLLYNFFWKIPAKLFRQKESQADLPSWSDIEINRFYFDPTSGFGVGLEIISHKKEVEYMGKIHDPYIDQVIPKLTRISKDGGTQPFSLELSSALPIVQGNTTFERFSHIQSIKDLERDKRKHQVISIAKWDDVRAWIEIGTVNNVTRKHLDEGKTHSIQIEIRDAEISPTGATMNPLIIKCDLLYSMGDDNKKKVSLEMTGRYPEYEKN